MASWKEIVDFKKNPERVRRLASTLLGRAEWNAWTDWEEGFLTSLLDWSDEFTSRQLEKLLQIRDDAEECTATREGFSIGSLLRSCYEARCDLDDDDTDFIEARLGRTVMKRREIGRLIRCARDLHIIGAP
jgi:hypothetical protein